MNEVSPHAAASFTLLIAIESHPACRAELARNLGEYLERIRQHFGESQGCLGAELKLEPARLVGRLDWRRKEDWEMAWDCRHSGAELLGESLMRLGARSIRFDSTASAA